MIVLGCGKSKLAHSAPASELYTGSLFRAGKRYALRQGLDWAILSARYGLVPPEEQLAPYDQVLTLRGAELDAWATRQARQLIDRWAMTAGQRVTLLMGATYARPFGRAARALGLRTLEPLEGLGLGKRLHWFALRDLQRSLAGEP